MFMESTLNKERNRVETNKNKAIYRRFIDEVFNKGRLEALEQLLSSSYIYRDAPPGTAPGWDGIRQIVTQFRSAFPDLHIAIEEQVAENDLVASRTTTRGTHRGQLFGIEATGKRVVVPGLAMVRVVDGHIEESWVKNDVASLMAQLGVAKREPAKR
jgi:steroid delta-isomerase-like uncharacterized protein